VNIGSGNSCPGTYTLVVGNDNSTTSADGFCYNFGSNNSSTGNNVAFGNGNVTTGNTVAGIGLPSYLIGNNNNVGADASSVHGSNNTVGANADGANVMGNGNNVTGLGTTTIGNNNTNSGDGSQAIGTGINVSGPNSVAIGNNTVVSGSTAGAIGQGASATATNAYAFGTGATASTANSVALGSGATTGAAVATSGATIAGTAYTFAGTAPVGVVSVGSAGAERQVQNVAAGQLTATSTDAVNGSQLYATNTAIGKLSDRAVKYDLKPDGTVDYTSVTMGGVGAASPTTIHNVAAGVAGTDAVNVDQLNDVVAANKTKYYSVNSTGGGNVANDGATGADAIAAGKDATATGVNAIAMGNAAAATTDNSVALGAGSKTAAVNTGTTGMYGATAAGLASAAAGTVSVGSAGAERQVQNVAAGVISATSTDAINGSQLNAVVTGVNNLGKTTAAGLGGGSTYNAGTGAVSAPTYQVYGPGVTTVNNVGDAITNIITQGPVQYSTADGKPTPYTPSNSVTLVGATSAPVTINNVAPAELSPTSTQAVNGSQLYATNLAVGAVDARVTQVDARVTNLDGRVTVLDGQNVKYDKNGDGSVNYNSVTLGGGKSTGPVGLHNVADGVAPNDAVNVSQLDAAKKGIPGGVAAAMAMAGLTQATEPDRLMLTGGLSAYDGSTGIALGASKMADGGRWVFKGGLALPLTTTGKRKVGLAFGAGFNL
jgi:autotransporter adhesin